MEYAEPTEQDAGSDGEDTTAPSVTASSSQTTEATGNDAEMAENAGGPPAVPPRPEPRGPIAPAGHKKFYKVIGSYRRGVLRFVTDELAKRGYFPTQDSERATVFWSRCFYPHLPSLKQNQKVNFLPAMAEICRKDFLNRNIKRAVVRFGGEHFSFWPISYNLPVEMAEFKADFEANPGPFILKPPLAARGEGIKLVTALEQVDEMPDYIKSKIPLAQRYVANPMLFFGHKMTFRIYAAITSWDPLRIYVFPNGLVRICSEKYTTDADSYTNSLVHLTNYDLQMDKEAAFNEEMPPEAIHDGLRSEIKHIFKELEEKHGIDTNRLWDEIHQLIAASVIAGAPIIQTWVAKKVPFRNNAFEVVGYDVLIDQSGKPWLLEINHTPSLSPHTELENNIKKEMLHELMDLVDIGNDGLASLIEETDKLWGKLQTLLEPEPERYQPREAYTWHDGLPFDVTQLSRADIWAILDSERENRRRGSWQRVLPAATDRFDPILPPDSRDILVAKCIRNNLGIAELAAMIDDVQLCK